MAKQDSEHKLSGVDPVLPPRITIILAAVSVCFSLVGSSFGIPILRKLGGIAGVAGLVGFMVYLLVLMLDLEKPSQPDTRLTTYIRAFFSDWGTLMVGPASVPFTALALWSTQRTNQLLWGSFAIVCGFYGSYRVWRKERLRRE